MECRDSAGQWWKHTAIIVNNNDQLKLKAKIYSTFNYEWEILLHNFEGQAVICVLDW